MPAVLDYAKCDASRACFPMKRCPNGAITFDEEHARIVIDSDLCGDCPGACTNFCDRYAIRFTPSPEEVEFLRAEVEGTMTLEEIASARAERAKNKVVVEEGGQVVELTSLNFEKEILQSDIPVVVDFWAEWCAPCRQLAPFYREMAKQYSGSLKFAKLNVDAEPVISQHLGIRNIPTLLFFYKGEIVDVVVGALPPSQLQTKLYGILTAIRALEEPEEADESAPVVP